MRAIDLVAGAGGVTEGATQAGVHVVWAANHWALAVETHALNHPATEHACQDLRQADWTALPAYDLLLASPACQGHSQASQPRRRHYHDALRATAWAVIDCAEVTRPKAVLVENVVDFRRWQLFPLWRAALGALGYHVDDLVLDASRFGVPQRRRRLFVVASRHRLRLDLDERPELAFGDFLEQDGAGWRPVVHASVGVQRRIAKGRRNCGARFLTQHVTGHPGVPLCESIRTITTKDQWALVDGDHYRPLTVRETARAMGFRDSYRWPERATRRDRITGYGNAVAPPVATALVARVAEQIERSAA